MLRMPVIGISIGQPSLHKALLLQQISPFSSHWFFDFHFQLLRYFASDFAADILRQWLFRLLSPLALLPCFHGRRFLFDFFVFARRWYFASCQLKGFRCWAAAAFEEMIAAGFRAPPPLPPLKRQLRVYGCRCRCRQPPGPPMFRRFFAGFSACRSRFSGLRPAISASAAAATFDYW